MEWYHGACYCCSSSSLFLFFIVFFVFVSSCLVGGFNSSEKYESNFIISPNRGEHIKYICQPPPSCCCLILSYFFLLPSLSNHPFTTCTPTLRRSQELQASPQDRQHGQIAIDQIYREEPTRGHADMVQWRLRVNMTWPTTLVIRKMTYNVEF